MIIKAAISRPDTFCPIIEEVELSPPLADEIRVKIVAAGICHTDINCHSGRGMPVPKPIVLGHEGAGIVEAVGEHVTDIKIGDHVLLSGNSCGSCPSCRKSKPMYCKDGLQLVFGGSRIDGSSPITQNGEKISAVFFGQSSFATHAIVPSRSAVKVDKSLPLNKLAPLGCGIITGAGSILEALKVRPNETIAIIGTGGVGLSAIMAAKICGAKKIIAIDLNKDRLKLALELGATHAISSSGEDAIAELRSICPAGLDYVFNTVNRAEAIQFALNLLGTEGTLCYVASPQTETSLPLIKMMARGQKIIGVQGGNAAPQIYLPLLIEFWKDGRFPFDRLITEFAFEDIENAWKACIDGTAIKPVLLFN